MYVLNLAVNEFINKEQKTSWFSIISDINKENINFSFENIWNKIQNQVNLNLIKIQIDQINQNKKSTNALGIKKGLATKTDKLYFFKLK